MDSSLRARLCCGLLEGELEGDRSRLELKVGGCHALLDAAKGWRSWRRGGGVDGPPDDERGDDDGGRDQEAIQFVSEGDDHNTYGMIVL